MLQIYILAAGKGTRMKSDLPKVLHPIAGKPMMQHVLNCAESLAPKHIFAVVGHCAELIKTHFEQSKVVFIEQQQQLGTGHAVIQGLDHFEPEATVLILYADVPLINTTTLAELIANASDQSLGLLTVEMDDPTGYGRIVRDDKGSVTSIVEHKDANADQLKIKEVNTGIMAVKGKHLIEWLPQLTNNNAQKEYYLPDIIALAVANGVEVKSSEPQKLHEVLGVNDRIQLAELERIAQNEIAKNLMAEGVSLLDPNRFDVRGSLTVGKDCVIDINCLFEGEVKLSNNVTVGPNCIIKNSTISDGVTIAANSIIEDSQVDSACVIGPFARLRPGTVLQTKAKVGNFVELKKANIGEGSKVNHLSYIGDAELGSDVNVGAGTITCNYDGVNKFKTTIKSGAFIGSNTALVAPVTVSENATVAAGSTITANVGDGQLAVARQKQRNIDGWQRPTKK